MIKEKLLEYYTNEIKIYKDRIEQLSQELSLITNIVNNSQSMIERINGGQFDE